MASSSIGFTGPGEGSGSAKGAIERTFSPEFRNRLDAIVQFNPLDPIAIARVVEKNLAELHTQLAEKHVTLRLTEAAKEYLAEKGFDRAFGARPMARWSRRSSSARSRTRSLRRADGGRQGRPPTSPTARSSCASSANPPERTIRIPRRLALR